jgi:hypothetical protein
MFFLEFYGFLNIKGLLFHLSLFYDNIYSQ